MKKIIYSLLIALSVTLALGSCSEEEIKPNNEESSGGVATHNDKGF